jgi:hypothetical protein
LGGTAQREDVTATAAPLSTPTRSIIDSRPLTDRPDPERLRVFVSYSRVDLDFADQLVIGLEFAGFAPTIDRHGISGGEDWKLRLGNLIRETNTVVFVLSPASAVSSICEWEVREAAKNGKRVIPVLCRPLDGNAPPQLLSDLNYIYFYQERTAPGSGFAAGLRELASALNTDIEWHREHTRILLRAMEWHEGGRQSARLLSGTDIQAAKEWAAKRPRTAPELSELQLAFIRASEEEAEARGNAERQRLAEVAAAQEARAKALAETETALRQVAEAQRRRGRLRNLLLVVMTLAAGISGWSWYTISQGNKRLTEQVQLAKAAAARAKSAEEQARSDQGRAQHAEFNAIINECTASRLLLETKPSDVDNLYNYLSCGLRLGFALIRENRPEDAKKFFGQIRDAATQKGTDQGDPVLSFYLLLISQGIAVAQCATMDSKSGARFDAIGQLVIAASEVLQFRPPTSIEQRWHKELERRWREELFRGLLYISNFSDESGDHDVAFQYASKLVDRLSNMPLGRDGSAREFARALDHLTWMALIAKRNSDALRASERAKQIVEEFDVTDLDSIRLNHAHALLFNDRTDEARKEYQSLNPDDVAKDVSKLMAVGLCDKMFVELIGPSGKCQQL